METTRSIKYHPEELADDVLMAAKRFHRMQEKIDYLTFVPDGEPTLDVNLGHEINLLLVSGVKIAVITNGSLLWKMDVRKDLGRADLVSLKVDAVEEKTWRKINRPHRNLDLKQILGSMLEFAGMFRGKLVTETMVIAGVNDGQDQLEQLSAFLGRLKPDTAYISIPTRPPALRSVHPAKEETLKMAYRIFTGKGLNTKYLIGYEGNEFSSTGNVQEDILSITAVHPMREDAILSLLQRAGEDWSVIDRLLQEKKLIKGKFNNRNYYLRKMKKDTRV